MANHYFFEAEFCNPAYGWDKVGSSNQNDRGASIRMRELSRTAPPVGRLVSDREAWGDDSNVRLAAYGLVDLLVRAIDFHSRDCCLQQ